MRLTTFYSNLNIKNKIFAVTILLLFVFFIMSITILELFSNMYEERIYKESAEMLHLSSTVLDQELKKIENLSYQISTDNRIQERLKYINRQNLNYEVYKQKSQLLDRMATIATQEKYISSIQIVDDSGEHYTVGYTKFNNELDNILPATYRAQGANVWTGIIEQNSLISSRQIREKKNISLAHLGILIITIDMNELIQETLNLSEDKGFVISRNDEPIYMTNINDFRPIPAMNGSKNYKIRKLNGKEYLITLQTSRYSQLTYFNILPFDEITAKTKVLKQLMILLFVFMLTLTLFLSRRAAKAISKPLEELTEKMKLVQNGKFESADYAQEKYLNDEFGRLHMNFRIMLDKINSLIKENYKKQLIIKETEYKALQAQINPHFLYNTLDSINWLAKVNKQPKISVIAEALGNMMRNIISKKAHLISIKDELDIVNNYITIQKYRYDQRLHFAVNISPDAEEYSIPKLTLQPIVENAIQHGLEEVISDCRISVSAYSLENTLKIVVKDNGPGMDEATIQSIYNGEIKSKSSGIGLYNIIERIKLMFGHEYGIEIRSQIGEGTEVMITLPFRME